jgi:hypothetical protein
MGQFISDASGATAAGDGTTDRSPLFERCSLCPSPTPQEPSFKRVNFVDRRCTLQFYVMFNDALYTTKRLFAGNVIRLLWPVPWPGLHVRGNSPAADILLQADSSQRQVMLETLVGGAKTELRNNSHL